MRFVVSNTDLGTNGTANKENLYTKLYAKNDGLILPFAEPPRSKQRGWDQRQMDVINEFVRKVVLARDPNPILSREQAEKLAQQTGKSLHMVNAKVREVGHKRGIEFRVYTKYDLATAIKTVQMSDKEIERVRGVKSGASTRTYLNRKYGPEMHNFFSR